MKEFVSKWSNWWILNPKRKQLDDAFEKELNELIEREVALRQPLVSGSLQINWDDVYEEANHRSPTAFDEYVKSICNDH